MLSTLTGALLLTTGVMGHGRLYKPMTRIGSETAYENDPAKGNQFICRHEDPNPSVKPLEVTAGSSVDLEWRTTAAHVGDCAFYLSYDVGADLEDMTWFKIGNKRDCKSFQNQPNKVDLPDWLPGGPAVLRWEWYALHVFPTIEFYAQCSDINVNPTGDAITIDNIPTFKVMDGGVRKSLPENGNEGVGFRNPFNPSDPQEMTGTNCALGSTLNNCELTAVGANRHVDVDAQVTTPVTVPTQPPVEMPAPSQEPSTSMPNPTPTDPPTSPAPVPNPTPTDAPVSPPPVPNPTPTYPPVESPTEPVDNCSSGALYAHYAQCDGEGFAQRTGDCQACPTGFQCFKKSKWYSNCNHSCPQGLGWECDSSMPAPTPSNSPAPAPETDGACPNNEHDTCGGEGRNVPTCCPEGMTCTVYSKWHSQCVRDA